MLLLSCDALTMTFSWLVASALYAFVFGEPLSFWFCLVRKSLLGSYLILNVFARLYHGNPIYPGLPLSPISEFARLVITSFGAGIIFYSYRYVYEISENDLSAVALLAVCVNMIVAQPARNIVRSLVFRFCNSLFSIPVVMLGPQKARSKLMTLSNADSHSGLKIVAGFERVEDAGKYAVKHGVKHCLCVQPVRVFREAMPSLLAAFPVVAAIPVSEAMPASAAYPAEFCGSGGIEFVNRSSYRMHRTIKFALELTLACLACVLFAVPALLIALMIWISNPKAPVIYKSRRKGYRGSDINVFKFRTMIPNADEALARILAEDEMLREEWKNRFKLNNDPRITAFGRFLRKTSLDELPQLLNVICGDMALIGPRPIVEKEVALYAESYREFSSVKPGITGLWQVSGRSETDYATRVALDLYYVRNWSVWMDLWIVRRTISEVIRGTGAK